MNTENVHTLKVQVVVDLICPWCFIAKRSLELAMPYLAARGMELELEWLPYQLNPDMPPEGMDRKEFRTRRFGWDTSLQMDRRAVEAGRSVGAAFDYSKQSRTPNTVPAHALARLAWEEGGSERQTAVMDSLFSAYFSHGQDISRSDTLERIADQAGLRDGAVERSRHLHDYVRDADNRNRLRGIDGVPGYLVDGTLLFSGSKSVENYVRLFGTVDA